MAPEYIFGMVIIVFFFSVLFGLLVRKFLIHFTDIGGYGD